MKETRISFSAGLFMRKHIREMLDGEVFCGRTIRWRERKGWFESQFDVRGNEEDIAAIHSRISAYMMCSV